MDFKKGDVIECLITHRQFTITVKESIHYYMENEVGQISKMPIQYINNNSFKLIKPREKPLDKAIRELDELQCVQSSTPSLYCSCSTPKKITNNAGGEIFYYCTNCKKEIK